MRDSCQLVTRAEEDVVGMRYQATTSVGIEDLSYAVARLQAHKLERAL
jgi:hypothetical protein